MPATNVYGVRIDDRFRDPEGNTYVVEKFITPTNMAQEWQAILQDVDTEDAIAVPVKDLKKWSRIMKARDFYEMIGRETASDMQVKVITPDGSQLNIVDIIISPDMEENTAYIRTAQ